MQQQISILSPADAIWALFQSQTKAVQKAITRRILECDVEAETMRQQIVVKQSMERAFAELAEAKQTGRELPNARNLFKNQ